MSVEDRLRSALDEAARRVDIEPLPLDRRSTNTDARWSRVGARRSASTFVLAAAAVVLLVAVGVWVLGRQPSRHLETQQSGPTAPGSTVPVSTIVTAPTTTAIEAEPTVPPATVGSTVAGSTMTDTATVVTPTTATAVPSTAVQQTAVSPIDVTGSTFMPSPPTDEPFPAATPPPSAGPFGPLSTRCGYTDPAKPETTIDVSTAMNCPNGESVVVHGVAFTDAAGNGWLCDAQAASSAATCAVSGLRLLSSPAQGEGDYRGVIADGTLRVGRA